MSAIDEATKALVDAGRQLKSDLWKADDNAFLAARAKDLVGLAAKIETEKDAAKKAGYVAAARDTLVSVKLLALIRMETVQQHVLEALGSFFMSTVLPALVKLLPALVAI